ncbi:MAG: hypothetical protein WAM14_14690 [Candidatus Nitrosopolaris sp.]
MINVDALTRPEVIREFRTAYPRGLSMRKLLIFRQNLPKVPRCITSFVDQTGINIAKNNQHDFSNDSELATCVITQFDDILNASIEKFATDLSYARIVNKNTSQQPGLKSVFTPSQIKDSDVNELCIRVMKKLIQITQKDERKCE